MMTQPFAALTPGSECHAGVPASRGRFRPADSMGEDESLLPNPSATATGEIVDAEPEPLNVVEAHSKCMALKYKGNEDFKAGKNEQARTAYAKAIQACRTHEADHAVGPIHLSLQLNRAAVCLKLERWSEAADSATAALAAMNASAVIKPTDECKAKYRRGVARLHLGSFSEAKEDLTAVCKKDPKNREARAALQKCIDAVKDRKAEQKAKMASIFSGDGKGLYKDEEIKKAKRLAEEKRKAEEEEVEKQRKEDELKAEWCDGRTLLTLALARRS